MQEKFANCGVPRHVLKIAAERAFVPFVDFKTKNEDQKKWKIEFIEGEAESFVTRYTYFANHYNRYASSLEQAKNFCPPGLTEMIYNVLVQNVAMNYPTVDISVVRFMMMSCNANEEKAREQLTTWVQCEGEFNLDPLEAANVSLLPEVSSKKVDENFPVTYVVIIYLQSPGNVVSIVTAQLSQMSVTSSIQTHTLSPERSMYEEQRLAWFNQQREMTRVTAI